MPYRTTDHPPPRRRFGECPSCHARVLPKADGECPSCRKNVDRAVDDGFRRLVVPDGRELPGICARCGSETARRTVLRVARTEQHGTPGWVRALLFLWNPILGLILPARITRHMHVELALCAECEPLRAEHADFDRALVTLLVHRKLRMALRQNT